jgi:uncharacterized protein (DUF1778 family)
MPSNPVASDDRIEPRTTKDENRLAGRIVLSERDTARVLRLLENPPKLTSALLAAARRRRRRT